MSRSLRTRIRVALKHATPWWLKATTKLVLARMPVGYSVLSRIGLARHGGMADPEWAADAFHRHYDNVEFARKSNGFTMLEIGPGDSLFSGMLAKAHGGHSSCLVDVGAFASRSVSRYRDMATYLQQQGFAVPDLASAESLEDVMERYAIRYETNGLESLKRLPDESFDFIFSAGALQHVYLDELPEVFRQIRRLVRRGGNTIHSFDFRDMMGQSLHHLRFSEKFWESKLIRTSGFYTNRLRQSQVLELAEAAGFDAALDEVNRWDELPVKRKSLKPPFDAMSDEDLRVMSNRVILQPRVASSTDAIQQAGPATPLTA